MRGREGGWVFGEWGWRGSKMGRHGFVVSGLAQIGDEEMRQWQRLGARGKERGTRREFGERG